MINFIHDIQQLSVFRTSIVHLQERSYAVCCNLVCLDTTGHIETYQITTYSIRMLLKMDC